MTAKTFVQIVADIVAKLPGVWSIKSDEDRHSTLTREDGLALYIVTDWRDNARAEVRPSVPRAEGGYSSLRDWGCIRYDEKGPEMSFAVTRDPARVAKEIERKVLEPYAPMYQKILATIADRDTRRNNAAALAQSLGRLLHVSTTAQEAALRAGRDAVIEGRAEFPGRFRICAYRAAVKYEADLSDDHARALAAFILTLEI